LNTVAVQDVFGLVTSSPQALPCQKMKTRESRYVTAVASTRTMQERPESPLEFHNVQV
jgi:hypothetical protein